jgi:hypothetical protein
MNDYEFEQDYWGDCCNTFDEDQKHYVYGRLMSLRQHGYSFFCDGKSILDIGGGPTSMLLKVKDLKMGKVVDPIAYPQWTIDRYTMKNIEVDIKTGEEVNETGWDEVWIYNCMQHAENPELIIKNALRSAPLLRIFEWIDIPAHEGHPHELSEKSLNNRIGQKGHTIELAESGCFGKAYFGVFTS